MRTIRVGLCFDPHAPGTPRVRKRLRTLDLVVFPELVDGGYAALRRGRPPHTLHDPFVQQFRDVSRVHAVVCVAGTIPLAGAQGRITNSCLVFRRGRLAYRYDKIHLFRPAGDHRYFARGSRPGTFLLGSGHGQLRTGIAICYDLRFPELMRTMAMAGMTLLIVPARWPASRDDAWMTLLKARAIENQIFVIGCNAAGKEGGFSYAFNPAGRLVYSSRTAGRAPLHRFVLRSKDLAASRRLHRNLREAVLLRNDRSRRRPLRGQSNMSEAASRRRGRERTR